MRPSWPCSASCSTRGRAEVKGCLSVSEHTMETERTMHSERTVELAAIDCPVVAESEVVVVGGGPAGVAAAVSAARSGVSVTLLERYPALGGLASGGMVLVLDDMINGQEITVTGIVSEYVERLQKLGRRDDRQAQLLQPPSTRTAGSVSPTTSSA